MTELKYKYADFIVEPRKVLLEFTAKDGILIVVPHAYDTPECVKERLDQIINYEFSEYLSNNESCMLCPKDFKLDADLVLENDKETGTQYFLSIIINDFMAKRAEDEIFIHKNYIITKDDGAVYGAMKLYFQNYVNNTLFSE